MCKGVNHQGWKLWTSISINVQEEICKWKVDNYHDVQNDLRKSGTKLLVHPALRCSIEQLENRIWEGKAVVKDGQIIVLGANLLGKIWMKYR